MRTPSGPRTGWWISARVPGEHGGGIVVSGPVAELLASPESLTGAYLTGRLGIAVPAAAA